MSKVSDINKEMQDRYYSLIIGLQDAEEAKAEQKEIAEASIQNDAGRELLRIEKLAQRDKDLNQRSLKSFIEGVRTKVHDEIGIRLVEQLEDTEELYSGILDIHPKLPEVLDLLSVRSSSIARIEPVIAQIPWLQTDLLKLINSKKYARKDRFGKLITVETLRMALGHFGIDNLQLIIPSMALRRVIPQITDPYPNIKVHQWNLSIGAALTCKALAEVCELNPNHAFTLGMFHEFGKMVVTKLYFRIFDKVQREALIEAQKAQKHDEHDALLTLVPEGEHLKELMITHSKKISLRIIERMNFKRVFIYPAMEEFVEGMALKEMTPMGRLLTQGHAYNKYRLLKSQKLINMQEAKEYLGRFQMPKGALAKLKTTDLRKLNLNLENVE